MTTIKQLNPPLPIYVVERGNGYAHFLIDYGIENHLYWVIFMDSTGECWTVANPQVRMQNNLTLGRKNMIDDLYGIAETPNDNHEFLINTNNKNIKTSDFTSIASNSKLTNVKINDEPFVPLIS